MAKYEFTPAQHLERTYEDSYLFRLQGIGRYLVQASKLQEGKPLETNFQEIKKNILTDLEKAIHEDLPESGEIEPTHLRHMYSKVAGKDLSLKPDLAEVLEYHGKLIAGVYNKS